MSVSCECCVLSGKGLCDELITRPEAVAYQGILFGLVQQIHLTTEDRDNGDLGAVAP